MSISNLVRDAEIYDRAADYIEEHGWIQGFLRTPDGVCTLGALQAVVGDQDRVLNLTEYMAEYAGIHMVAYWNDAPGTTKKEVVTTLRFVAERIRATATQMIRMGDIGEPKREIEFEPFPASEPVKEPARTPVETPAEPEKVPA